MKTPILMAGLCLALAACASPYEIAKDGLRGVKTTETEITSSLKG